MYISISITSLEFHLWTLFTDLTFARYTEVWILYFIIKLQNNTETSGEVKSWAESALAVIIVIYIGKLGEEEPGEHFKFSHFEFKFSPVPF